MAMAKPSPGQRVVDTVGVLIQSPILNKYFTHFPCTSLCLVLFNYINNHRSVKIPSLQ